LTQQTLDGTANFTRNRGSRPAAWLRRLTEPRMLILTAVVVVLVYLVIGPLAMLLFTSLRSADVLPLDPAATWTLANYAEVLRDPATYRLLANTLIVSTGSMGLAFVISALLAWLIERTDVPFPNFGFVLIVAGLGIPGFITGIAWVILANPTNGVVNVVLRAALGLAGRTGPVDIYSMTGFIFLQGISFVPATFLLVAAAFRAMDAKMEEAANTSGAGTFSTMRRITIPILAPALFSAFIYMFITVVESFDVPLTIGLRADIIVLSTRVYLDLNPAAGFPNYALASVHGVVLFLLGLVPLLYYNRLISRAEEFATISGRGFQRSRINLGFWRWPAFAFMGLYGLLSVILPALVMFWTSLQPFYALPSTESLARANFGAYREIVSSPSFIDAIRNTLIMAVVAGLLAMGIAFITSWIVVRSRYRARAVLDVLAFMPHIFPAAVLALSLLVIYLMAPVPVYGTIWILVIGIMTRYLGISTRFMNAGVTSLQVELEEAAAVSGATWLQSMRRVVLPLVLPSFVNGFLIVALLAIQQLAIPLILASSDNRVLSTLIWGRWAGGDTAEATALSVMVLAMTSLIAIIARRTGNLSV
jgi:iron(III) transport system permease protein